uniref:Uncharacterized protein n=1 Tax=Rhizophora mucronata TaxID=61149 RepID=A0A2P2QAS0_RHIMU
MSIEQMRQAFRGKPDLFKDQVKNRKIYTLRAYPLSSTPRK